MGEENSRNSVLPEISNRTLTSLGRPILSDADLAEFESVSSFETIVVVIVSPKEEMTMQRCLKAISGKMPAFRTRFIAGTLGSKQEIARCNSDPKFHQTSVPGAVAVDYTGSLVFDHFRVNSEGLIYCRRYVDKTVRDLILALLHPGFVEESIEVSIGCLEIMPDDKHLEEIRAYLAEVCWAVTFSLVSLKKLSNRKWSSLFIKRGTCCWVPSHLERHVEYLEAYTPDPYISIMMRIEAAKQIQELTHSNYLDRDSQPEPSAKPHQSRDQQKKKTKKVEAPKRYIPPEVGMLGARMKDAKPFLTDQQISSRAEQSGVPITNRFQTLGLGSDDGGQTLGARDPDPPLVTSTPKNPVVKEIIDSKNGAARPSRKDSHILEADLIMPIDPNSANNVKLGPPPGGNKSRIKRTTVDVGAVNTRLVKMANGDQTPQRPGASVPGKRTMKKDAKVETAANHSSSPSKKMTVKPLYPTDQLAGIDEHKEVIGILDVDDVSDEDDGDLFKSALEETREWSNSTMKPAEESSESNPSRESTPCRDEIPEEGGRDERIDELLDRSVADEAMACVRSGPGVSGLDRVLVDPQTLDPVVAQQILITEGRPLQSLPGFGSESLPLNSRLTQKYSKRELTTTAASHLLKKLDAEIQTKMNMKLQLLKKFPMSSKVMMDEDASVKFKESDVDNVGARRLLDKIFKQKSQELKVIKRQKKKIKHGGTGILKDFRDLLDWDMNSESSVNEYESIMSVDLDDEKHINQQSEVSPPSALVEDNKAESQVRRPSGNLYAGDHGVDDDGGLDDGDQVRAGPSHGFLGSQTR